MQVGKIIERELLGSIDDISLLLEPEYYGHYAAYHFVKQHQPWDPMCPEPPFLKRVQKHLVEALKLPDASYARFYTAIGSVLDHKHKVDMIISVRLKFDKAVEVTLDLTADPNKHTAKAEILYCVPSEDTSDTPLKLHAMALAEIIASKVREKYQQGHVITIDPRS